MSFCLSGTSRFQPRVVSCPQRWASSLGRKLPLSRRLQLSQAASKLEVAHGDAALAHSLEGARSAILWLKQDLRTDDHLALAAIASCPTIERLTPLYILDPELLGPVLASAGPAGPEVLAATLASLRRQLRALGSDLVVRGGPCDAALRQLVSELAVADDATAGAAAVLVAEDEALRGTWAEERVAGALAGAMYHVAGSNGGSNGAAAGSSRVVLYRDAAAWDEARFEMNYRRWEASRGGSSGSGTDSAQQPLPAPSRLPRLAAVSEPGEIPTAGQLRDLLRLHRMAKEAAAAAAASPAPRGGSDGSLHALQTSIDAQAAGSMEAGLISAIADLGPDPLQILVAYLLTEPAAAGTESRRASAGEEELRLRVGAAAEALEPPSAPGASFKAVVGPWMELGALSRRRVFQRAAAGRGGGAVALRAEAAERAASVSEFHSQLATVGATRGRPAEVVSAATSGSVPAPGPADRGALVRQFRWRGTQSEYCVAEPSTPRPGAPAVLLVHGFGAFGDQWRGNIAELAAAGYRVFAPTLPGFGRSEKAAMAYSQDLWRDFLRDFTLQVVGGKAVVAGNSIGGFIAASMAGDYPDLVAGLVLLNSAGPVDPGFSMAAHREACERKKKPPRFVIQLFSRALFWYLELSIGKLLKWLYPTAPDRADAWLAEEIYRAACDRGSLEVFQAAFYLPPPRALNYLVGVLYGGPTLVLQGALDPLNDAKSRARDLAAACPLNVEVVLVEAGHCPHDEQPAAINREMLKFMGERVLAAPKTLTAAASS